MCFFLFSKPSQAGFFDWLKLFKKNNSQNAKEIVSKIEQNTIYTLSISKQGSGVVTSDDGKINCRKQCQASYSANSEIILKAEAGENYKFERWNGCDKVSDGQCHTTLNKSKLIVAKFALKKSSLSQKSSSSSVGKISSSKSSAVSSKTSSSKAFSASKSSSSVASKQTQNFKTLTIKNIFYNKEKGIVKIGNKICDVSQCVFEYDLNTSLELQAESESGSVLSDWGYDCDYVFAPNNICNLIMNSNKTVIVHFEPRVSVASFLKSSSASYSSKSSSLSSSGEASSSSSLFTNNQYYLRITSPNEGETWKKGSRQAIKFTTNKFDRFITLKLYKNNNYLLDIGYYDIAYSNPSKNPENVYSWNVPSSLNDGEDYKIYATITNSKELYGYEISDWSDNVFTIKTGTLANLYKKEEIVVIEDDGTFINSDGSIELSNITKRFYQSYDDDYDFLAIYPDFSSVLGGNYAISSKINGTGLNEFDNTTQYGSKGKLKAISNVELGLSAFNEENYKNGVKYQDMYTLAHEIGHTWCCYIKNEPSLTTPNTWIRGHWIVSLGHPHSEEYEKKWLDTDTDILGGGDFVDNKDGTFTMSSWSGISIKQKKFFPFTLYLMGLIPSENVPSASFIEFESPVNSGKTTKGTKKEITINDIIKNNGEREPAYPNAQKNFNTAFILITEKGKDPKTETISRLTEIVNEFPNYWAVATHCKSTMTTNLNRNNKIECQSAL